MTVWGHNSSTRTARLRRTIHGLIGALMLAALFAPSAAADDFNPQFDLWPIFRYWHDAEKDDGGWEALGPFFEWFASPSKAAFFFRPIYNKRNGKPEKVVESDFIWPFGSGTRRPDLVRRVFWPLYLNDAETYPDKSDQKRSTLLPFWLYRRGKDQPTDFMLWPLYGKIHNYLARDEWRFVLWPLYMYDRIGPCQGWSFPFPFLKYVKWDDGGSGFKFWPLFGWKNRPGKLRTRFYIWPFYMREWRKTDQGEFNSLLCFPFYGYIDAPKGYSRAYLWPFFGTKRDDNVGFQDWWYPWPFFGHRRGENISARRFWPLISWENRIRQRFMTFIWPLGWTRSDSRPGKEAYSFRFVPLYLREWEKRQDSPDRYDGVWQLWPVAKHRYSAKGESNFEFPSVWPFRYHAEWDRNFAPFFRIFEYRRMLDQQRTWRLLWRLIRVDAGPRDSYVEIIPLFHVHSRKDDVKQWGWSLLKGLFAYRSANERRQYKFLYLFSFGDEVTKPEAPREKFVEVWPLYKTYSRDTKRAEGGWSVLKGLVGRRSAGEKSRWQLLYFIRWGASEKELEDIGQP
jgi:hypothetical protein